METMNKPQLDSSDLAHFIGTNQWYRLGMGNILLTDGTMHVAKEGQAVWLMQAIASHQSPALDEKTGGFQLWILKVNDDNTAVLTCQADTGTPELVRQEIPYTDFPLNEIKLYVEGVAPQRVLLLPSEH